MHLFTAIRDQIVIVTKLGFSIDAVPGERSAGLNSRPDNVKQATNVTPVGSS